MKISIIVPVYNERESIVQCLDAILGQDYPKEDFEVIVVNDGSTDGTLNVVERYPVRLINLEANSGRIVTRETGARAAKFDFLLFIDSRYIIQGNDFLKKMAGIGHQPLFPVAIEEKYGSPFNTLFYLMRKKWYQPYYPFDNYPAEFWINEENFDKVPKGMSIVFIDKSLFLSSIPNEKGKMVNDDTRLLWELVRKRKILRHSDIKVHYLQRTGFWEVIGHIYERGPRFADYYLKKGGRYRGWYLVGLPTFCVLSITFFLKPEMGLFGIVGLFLLYMLAGIWLGESFRDFLIVLLYLPPLIIAFVLGILRGMLFNGNGK